MRPLLSVWFRPRVTIDHVLANQSRYGVLVLAALSNVAAVANLSIDATWTADLLDWRALGLILAAGCVLGVVELYIGSWCLRWSGKLFRGHASAAQLRALLAWGFVPTIAGLAFSLAILLTMKAGLTLAPKPWKLLLQVVTGALGLWSLIIAWRMLARVQQFGLWRAAASGLVGWLFYAAIFLLPISIRTFAYQPFDVPSGSSMPSLLAGDSIFVSKYAYGYSRYSFPFSLASFSGRIWGAEPQRGDMVVFRLPRDPSLDYVKRIVGLPGDRIQMMHGILYINGRAVEHERVSDFTNPDDGETVKQWRETLPNGVSYYTLDLVENGFADDTELYTVQHGHYFTLGDNRDNSTDSRFPQIGQVPFENLIGRVEVIFLSLSQSSGGSSRIRFDRIGTKVH